MSHPLASAVIPGGSTLVFVLVCLYFVPTAVAIRRAHHQLSAILIVNVFLGWTFVGWVVALAMAFTQVEARPPRDPQPPGHPAAPATTPADSGRLGSNRPVLTHDTPP